MVAFGMISLATLWLLLFAPQLSAVESHPVQMTLSLANTQPHHNNAQWQQHAPGTPHADKVPRFSAAPHDTQYEHHHQAPDSQDSQKPLMSPDNSAPRPVADLSTIIADLPAEHSLSSVSDIPDDATTEGHKTVPRRRLVFIGDVHGHLTPLKALLRKVEFDHRKGDHLIFVGDIVAKGPDSAGVVRLAMKLGASAVRGNHEDKVLLAHKAMQRERKQKQKYKAVAEEAPDSGSESDDELSEARLSKHEQHARAVARSLSAQQLKWLSSLPIILRLGQIPGAASPPWNAAELVVVHAGLVPGVPLAEQDSWAVMNMRTLTYLAAKEDESEEKDIAVPSDARDGEPWSHVWNRWSNVTLTREAERMVVVYGHDAREGLQTDMAVDIRRHPKGRKKHRKHRKQGVDGEEIEIETETEEIDDDDEPEETQSPGLEDAELEKDELEEKPTDLDAATGHHKKKPKHGKGKKKHHHGQKNKKKGIRYAFGIDSGCGHGRQLSALAIEAAAPDGTVAHRVEQVECTKASDSAEN